MHVAAKFRFRGHLLFYEGTRRVDTGPPPIP